MAPLIKVSLANPSFCRRLAAPCGAQCAGRDVSWQLVTTAELLALTNDVSLPPFLGGPTSDKRLGTACNSPKLSGYCRRDCFAAQLLQISGFGTHIVTLTLVVLLITKEIGHCPMLWNLGVVQVCRILHPQQCHLRVAIPSECQKSDLTQRYSKNYIVCKRNLIIEHLSRRSSVP